MENISLIHFRMTFKRVGKEAMHPELEETPVFMFNLQNYIIFMNHEPILLSTGLVIGLKYLFPAISHEPKSHRLINFCSLLPSSENFLEIDRFASLWRVSWLFSVAPPVAILAKIIILKFTIWRLSFETYSQPFFGVIFNSLRSTYSKINVKPLPRSVHMFVVHKKCPYLPDIPK